MTSFILYIIKSGCCLALFYTGYKLLLSHETFFHFNRKILLTGMFVCMLLPLIKIKIETSGIIQQPMIQLERIMTEDRTLVQAFSVNSTKNSTPLPVSKQILPIPLRKQIPPISLIHLLALIFVIGGIVNICLIIRSYISLYLLIHNGEKVVRDDCTIVLLNSPVVPFNYGRYIILSEKDYSEHQEPILTHELAHFRFFHSFDIIMMELLTLLQWFNPFIRLLKKEMRSIHEFQADAEVLFCLKIVEKK